MRFEEQVTVLCAEALVASDDADARKILAELRLVLHQHIEQLRSGLLVAYKSMIRPEAFQHARQKPGLVSPISTPVSHEGETIRGTWQRLVHEIASEEDYGRALQLSQELSSLLQRQAESPGQS